MNPFAVGEDRLREIAAPYGGVDALNQRMALFNQATARLNRDWTDLMAQYPDHWVAVGPNGMLAAAPTMEALLSDMRAAQKDDETFVVDVLDTSPGVLIL